MDFKTPKSKLNQHHQISRSVEVLCSDFDEHDPQKRGEIVNKINLFLAAGAKNLNYSVLFPEVLWWQEKSLLKPIKAQSVEDKERLNNLGIRAVFSAPSKIKRVPFHLRCGTPSTLGIKYPGPGGKTVRLGQIKVVYL